MCWTFYVKISDIEDIKRICLEQGMPTITKKSGTLLSNAPRDNALPK